MTIVIPLNAAGHLVNSTKVLAIVGVQRNNTFGSVLVDGLAELLQEEELLRMRERRGDGVFDDDLLLQPQRRVSKGDLFA